VPHKNRQEQILPFPSLRIRLDRKGEHHDEKQYRLRVMKSLWLQLLLLALVVFHMGLHACAAAQALKTEEPQGSIGVATMKDDGTIVLRLRAKTPHGGVGEGSLIYPPTHPEYKKILSHIEPIRKGQTVPVRPWPD
jgi:hypothetical protein